MLNAVLTLVSSHRSRLIYLSLPVIYVAFQKGWIQAKHIAVLMLLYFVARARSISTKALLPAASVSSAATAEIKTFEDAAAFVQSVKGLSNEQKLNIYGLFKQATAGDCATARPRACATMTCVASLPPRVAVGVSAVSLFNLHLRPCDCRVH